MGDEDGGNAQLLLDPADFDLQVFAKQRVNGAQRFIQQEDLRGRHHSAGQGNALLLTAGKLCGVLADFIAQSHDVKHLFNLLADFRFGQLFQLQTVGHVVPYVHVGEEGILLEDHADTAAAGNDVGDFLPVQVDMPAGDLLKAGQTAQQGGFSAAGGTQQRDQLPLFHIQVNVFEHVIRAKEFIDFLKSDVRHGLLPSVSDLLKSTPVLQGQHDGGDGKGDQHDDHKHGRGLGAGAFHGLIEELLHVVHAGAGQVPDNDVITEQETDRQQAGDGDACENVGDDDLEKGA